MKSSTFMKTIEFVHGTFMVLLLAKLLVEAKAVLGLIPTTRSFAFFDLSITFRVDACCSSSFSNILPNPMKYNMYFEAINLA